MKFYKTLDEAFDDIEVGQSLHKRVEMMFLEKDMVDREKAYQKKHDSTADWIKKLLKLKTFEEDNCKFFIKVYPFISLYIELVGNAWEHGSRFKTTNKFVIDIYAGKKGLLIGTEQLKGHFLSAEQITELKAEKPATSRRTRGGPGGGTDIYLDYADVILIREQEKAIYVAKYFENEWLGINKERL